MSNFVEGSSESLVIAEGNQDFQINSSEEKPKNDDDLFELSRDQPSVSLQIQEEQKHMKIQQLYRKSKDDTLQIKVIDQAPPEENRRKRKEIFDKYKKEKSVISKVEESKGTDNLLNIFDSIFNKKSQGAAGLCGVFDLSSSIDQNRPILEGISIRSRTPSAEKRRLKIFNKKKTADTYQSVLPENINENKARNQPEVIPVLQKDEIFSPIRVHRQDESYDLETIEKRISLIQPVDQDVSRDSFEINNILQSQIFRDENGIEVKQKTFQVQQLPLQEKAPDNLKTQLQQPIKVDPPKQIQQLVVDQRPTSLKTILQSQPKEQNLFKRKDAQVVQVFQAGNMQKSQVIGQLPNSDSVATVAREQRTYIDNLPIDQTKYLTNNLNNDTSSLSSVPSVYIQNYDSRKLQLNGYNSMANIHKKNYEEMTTPRMSQLQQKNHQFHHYNGSVLVQSRVIQNVERINIAHSFEQEVRLPVFLRRARRLISVYPNFYILKNNPNTSQVVVQQFHTLIEQLKKAVSFLCEMCQKVLDAKVKKQLYMQQIMSNLSVESFLDMHWEQTTLFSDKELIKPVEPIEVRTWNYQKAKTALANYQNVVNHYGNKGLKLDLNTDKGRKKYFDIRQKFWDICGNMKLIGQDVYCQMNNCTLPKHYQQFRTFLSSPFPGRLSQPHLEHIKKLMSMWRHFKNEKDQLINSTIGAKIKEKLQLEMRYLVAF